MFNSLFNAKIRSGDSEYPTRKDVFEHLLVRLQESRSNGWAHFSCPARGSGWFKIDPFIEVALDDDNFLMNFGSFSRKDLAAIRNSQFPFPATWIFEDGDSLLRIPAKDFSGVVLLLEYIFERIVGAQPIDSIHGYLDGLNC